MQSKNTYNPSFLHGSGSSLWVSEFLTTYSRRPLLSLKWADVCRIARDAREHNCLTWLYRTFPDIPWMSACSTNKYEQV